MKSRLQPSAFWQMEIYCQTENGNEDAHFGVSLKTIYADLGVGCQGCGPPPENSNYEINTVRYPKTGPDLHEKQNYP